MAVHAHALFAGPAAGLSGSLTTTAPGHDQCVMLAGPHLMQHVLMPHEVGEPLQQMHSPKTKSRVCALFHVLPCFVQDKVVNSTSELYSFMDSADSTLALKVLGEVDEDGMPVAEDEEVPGGYLQLYCGALVSLNCTVLEGSMAFQQVVGCASYSNGTHNSLHASF